MGPAVVMMVVLSGTVDFMKMVDGVGGGCVGGVRGGVGGVEGADGV